MLAAVVRGVVCVALLSAAGAAHTRAQGQSDGPLRKTDLVRLLTGGTLVPYELAALVRRHCLSFTPTSRDRADLTALGADSAVLREIDACVRQAGVASAPAPPAAPPESKAAPPARSVGRTRQPATGAPRRPPASVAPTEPRPAPVEPPPRVVRRAQLSAARSAFILGAGQRGTVGSRLARPLVFEVRDTAGVPVSGEAVTLAATNGRLVETSAVTDSSGRVQVDLAFGAQAGPTVVTAKVGSIQRQVTLYATAGPAAKLSFSCGDAPIDRRVALSPDVSVVFHVTAQDAFGNAVPLEHLQAAAGDKSVVRVAFIGSDNSGGLVGLKPGETGSTSLAVLGSGQRQNITVIVVQRPGTGDLTRCP
jgi:Big-like domain-containing protein